VIAPIRAYNVYFTNYAPNTIRFRVLNADKTFKVRLSVYYITPNRVDVFTNGLLAYPTNAQVNSQSYTLIDPGNDTLRFKPNISSPIGTNFMNRTEKMLYFAIDGSGFVDLVVTQTLFIQFNMRDILPVEFYKSQDLVNNIASLFAFDKKSIRRVEPVNENRNAKSLKTGSSRMIIVIENEPAKNLVARDESFSSIVANVTMKFAAGSIETDAQKLLNVTIQSGFIELSMNTNETQCYKLAKINRIKMLTGPKSCREQSPCDQQPVIQVLDDSVRFFKIFKVFKYLK
jgi:hypothetical protein